MAIPAGENPQVLLVFVKNPVPGRVKTRLSPPLTPRESSSFYRAMVEDILDVHARGDFHDTIVYFTPAEDRGEICEWLGSHLRFEAQEGADLGARMHNALRRAFADGYERAIVIGSDCLLITPGEIQHAFASLHDHDLVIGPSEDGGYYLLGASDTHPTLFDGIEWSGTKVLHQTMERIDQAGLRVLLLDPKFDIDSFQDAQRLHASMRDMETHPNAVRCMKVLSKLL